MMMTTTTQKRKAVDQVNHDFSDFSLSSPATKIRRLDYAELAPIMEEDEHQLEDESHMPPPPPFTQQQETLLGVGEVENEERAIVLFNPNNTILQSSPSTFSLTPHILSRLKGDRDLWSKHLLNNSSAQQGEDTTLEEQDDDISDQCLAVVPWVHSHLSPPPRVQQIDASETMMMEAEQQFEQEIASMDIEQQEECNNNGCATSGNEQRAATGFGGPSGVGFHQWQQQHCMVPSQLPHNAATAAAPTPVVWFR